MIKTQHGHTNFESLIRLILITAQNQRETAFTKMGNVAYITPHGNSEYTLRMKSDEIRFRVDVMQLLVVPLHITNIIDDIDKNTLVTGTNIPIKHVMTLAVERLYQICKMYDTLFEFGIEII